MTTTDKSRAGFTLMEILIVVAIIMALAAFLLPTVFSARRKFNEDQARLQIERFETLLLEYDLKERGYPTNEQGLYALLYIPDNVGGFQQPGMGQTNPIGMDQSQQFDNSMFGGSGGIGPTDPMNQQGVQNPMDMNSGFPTMPGQQMTDQMSPDGTVMGGTAWNQPVYNPQLYMQQRKRSAPYASDVKELIDPWKSQYRYDNSRDQYGLNPYTGEDKPAIWSAGYDKIDGTDDDIRNWIPSEAAQKRQEHMQRLQMQQQQMGGMMDNSMFGGSGGVGPSTMNNMPGGMPNNMPGGMPSNMPGGMPNNMPGGMPNNMPGGMPNNMPGGMPNNMPGGMPNNTPGGMPNNMPGGM